jgi:hypothetical protein
MSEEFKWYEFETRMRKTILELIEPTIQRLSKEREKVIHLKKQSKIFEEKLNNIETLLGFGKEKSGWMEDMENHIRTLNVKIAEAEATQESRLTKAGLAFEKTSCELSSLDKRLEGIVKRNEEFDQQVSILSNSLNSQADFLTKYLESNKEDFSTKLSKVLTENFQSQAKFDSVSGQIVEVTQKLSSSQNFIEKTRVQISEIMMKLQKLSHEKIENEHLFAETSKINTKIVNLIEKTKKNEDKIHEIFRYLDVYLPKEIQASISDNFYSIPDKNFLRKFNFFEELLIKESMASSSIGESSTIEEIFKRAIGSNQRMIKRSNDFRYTGDLKKLERINSKNSFKFDEESEEPQQVTLHKTVSQTDYLLPDISLQNKAFQSTFHEELHRFKEEIRSNERQTEVFLEILRNGLEDVKSRMKNDREIFDKELINFSAQSERFERAYKKLQSETSTQRTVTKELLEGIYIVFSLLVNDEEESKGMNWNKIIEKNEENKPNHAATETDKSHWIKKGFSGKKLRTRVVKHKDVTFERSELIEVLGTIIKASSVKANVSLEIQKKPDSHSTQRTRINSALTSRKKIFSFG